jgi:hypothetical protein
MLRGRIDINRYTLVPCAKDWRNSIGPFYRIQFLVSLQETREYSINLTFQFCVSVSLQNEDRELCVIQSLNVYTVNDFILSVINCFLGPTVSPINIANVASHSVTSAILTCFSIRVSGFIVVSHS